MRNHQFEKNIHDISSKFPTLNIFELENECILKGHLDIIDEDGYKWDSYDVEIRGTNYYPKMFPSLFETGNAFPKVADWHVNENDGSCCIDIQANEILICKDGISIEQYISEFAIPYLANQSFRTREGYYLYGEYSHGLFGIIEYYQEQLKAGDFKQLIDMLFFILNGYDLSRTANCPFCKKSKFRQCHRGAFSKLSTIKHVLFHDAKKLYSYFILNPSFTFSELMYT